MTRTTILCPECMKKKLLTNADDTDTYCDECGTKFIITAPNRVKYK